MEHPETNTPRAYRPAEGIVLAGVCAGIAEHLRIPVLWVRLVFAVGILFNGASLVAYAILWRFMPLGALVEPRERDEDAQRRAMLQTVAIGAVVVGLLLLLNMTGRLDFSTKALPIALAVIGVAVVWRLLDEAAMNTWMTRTSGAGFWLRLAVGMALILAGVVAVVSSGRGFGAALDVAAALVLAIVGGLLLLGPWALKLRRDLATERVQRIREQERADMAAHLHDSVLQTLALLQKNANDPDAVVSMSRRQERELRNWLQGVDSDAEQSLAAAIRNIAAAVEDSYRVKVELVTVGDVSVDENRTALLAATREAIINAAKHSGAKKVDVFVESVDGGVEVFIRDRGVGFEPGRVSDDRRGIEESIRARMARHGGTVSIESTLGEGTEVRLSMSEEEAETP